MKSTSNCVECLFQKFVIMNFSIENFLEHPVYYLRKFEKINLLPFFMHMSKRVDTLDLEVSRHRLLSESHKSNILRTNSILS